MFHNAQEAPSDAKRAPRDAEESSKRRQGNSGTDSGAILEGFRTPRPRKTMNDFSDFRNFPREPQQELQKASKRAPREATKSLRSGPGGASSDPRGPKTAPRAARSESRARREPPKRLPKGFKIVVLLVSAPGAPPGGLRGRFWRDLGLDFGCCGHHFGAILGPQNHENIEKY